MSLVSDTKDSSAVSFLRELVALYRQRDIPLLAGSVAYSAFLSLIPLVILLMVLAALVGGESLQQVVLTVAQDYLTPQALSTVQQALTQASYGMQFSVFSGVVLLWAVLKVFRTLDAAFADLYLVETTPDVLEQFKDAAIVLSVITTATLAMVAAGAALSLVASRETALALPVVQAVGFLSLVAGLTVVFLLMYYIFPDVEMTLRGALPGAVFAAVGWAVLQGLFQLYVSVAEPSRLYGVLGGIILFVTWLYFGSLILLTGAGVNIVASGRRRGTD